MKDSRKWIYRILLILLIVVIIDLNANWQKSSKGGHYKMIIADIFLVGFVIIPVLFKNIRRRL